MAHNNLAEEGNTNNHPPLFNGTNYSSWKNPMKYHIISEGVEYWKIIIFGPQAPLKENGELKTEMEYDDNDWKQAYINAKAMKLIYCALTVEERNRVNSFTSTKEMWERLRITHEGTNQVRETKINMLLHDYEMFVMKDGESISTMLDRFAEIINGLGNLGKHMTDSEKVKKILRSLPKEWDSQVTTIMESKDLNHLEFNALVGSLINYEIILKSRGGRGKSQKSIALKVNISSLDESDEEIDEEEDDEEIAMYARKLKKFKGLLKNQRKELNGGRNGERKKFAIERRSKGYDEKKSNEECWKCGKRGHHARECKSSSSTSNFQKSDKYDKGKKKASLLATWSDDEEAYQSNEENNLALMANSSSTSDDEEEVTLFDQDLRDSFNALQIDFEEAIEIKKNLRKKIRELVTENNALHETIDDLDSPKEDHSACLVEKENLICELDRLRKEFSYVVQAKDEKSSSTWYIDSGCSRHMSGDKNLFEEIKPKNQGYVTFGDNNKGKVIGIGKVGNSGNKVEEIESKIEELKLDEENHAPDIKTLAKAKNHPMEQVIGDLNDGLKIRRNVYENMSNSAFISLVEPKNIKEALEDENWLLTMQEELNQFKRNNVWDLVAPPKDKTIIGVKWVNRIKYDENGEANKNKSRLVAQGFYQKEGLDYNETYAPVARLEAIRLLCAFASHKRIKLNQMDVKSAFLNGYIQEEVYVKQPPGFEDHEYPDYVYKLKKALYGLKQAPRAWYERLSTFLTQHEYVRGKIDNTLFIKHVGQDMLICQIYVDDIVFGATSEFLCKEFSDLMQSEFEMSMMGELKFFLGLQIKQLKNGIFIHQSKYTKELLKKFKTEGYKVAATPMETNLILEKHEHEEDVDKKLYRGPRVQYGPRVRESSSRGDASREDDVVEPRFVSRDVQILYYKVLQNEVLIPSMRFDWSELDHSEFTDVFSEIANFGLRDFLGYQNEIYEEVVRDFYANLFVTGSNVEDVVYLKSKINEKEIFLCEANMCTLFRLSKGGVRPRASFIDFGILRNEDSDTDEEAEENFGYTEEKGADLLSQLCSDHSPPFEAMDLPLNYRLLLYAINRVVYPKKSSNNQITSLDKEILWHMEEERKINYPSLIIQMMRKKASLLRGQLKGKLVRHKGTPYAALISSLAQLQRCDLNNYAHYPYPQSWRFTHYNLRSMKLVKIVEKGWVYSYHVEKLGLTFKGEQVPLRQRSKRVADRPSSSRPSNVRRSEVSHEELNEINDQLDDLNDCVDNIQSMFVGLAKKVDAQHRMLKKIFKKLGCRHDDSSS
ncbi:hypothetical protein K2173_023708 [Erythroxylum novogranatense]|uniref:Gag-pol polyprotein n=1 Tax=Erythroxylum novogranatense TaxID=1862640 RepID=A0AAV8TRR5_9ROSI|nr:hypothetical protein K2173_023708 [Erythroxylum novogranatense]